MKTLITLLSLLAITTLAKAQNLQGGMETWQNYSVGGFPSPAVQLEKPVGWCGGDSLVCSLGPFLNPSASFKKQLFKSTITHGGTYAAHLINRDQDTLGIVPGVMTNAIVNVDLATLEFEITGGTPVTARIDTVKAWVRYLPRGVDEGEMSVFAVRTGAGAGGTDSVVGIGSAVITADTAYYEIQAVLSYPTNEMPNALQVVFWGNVDFFNSTDSTELWVDDVSAVGSVGIKTHLFKEPVVEVYPNPASNVVYINNANKETLTWELYTITGAKLMQVIASDGKTEADISAVASGNYIFQIRNKQGDIVQTGKLNVAR